MIEIYKLNHWRKNNLLHSWVWSPNKTFQVLIIKLIGICDALLDLIESFLENRFQGVVLNGQTSDWLLVRAGVSQGSILGSMFFLIYINDQLIDIISTV